MRRLDREGLRRLPLIFRRLFTPLERAHSSSAAFNYILLGYPIKLFCHITCPVDVARWLELNNPTPRGWVTALLDDVFESNVFMRLSTEASKARSAYVRYFFDDCSDITVSFSFRLMPGRREARG